MVLENALQTSPETIFPEKQSLKSAESAVYFVFPEILFPEASLKWFYSVKLRTDYDNFRMILIVYKYI